jgi:hypothetical protein
MNVARRFFRAIESEGGWECHQGTSVLDSHTTLLEAIDHLFELGEMLAPSQVFSHYLDGRVVSVATFDSQGPQGC